MDFLNVFASVDTDQDLVIHRSDLDAYAERMKYKTPFTKKWLSLFDHDNDGSFTFGDFCEALGLNEKIYADRLREIRLELQRKQQEEELKREQQGDQQKQSRIAARRANRQNKSGQSQPESEAAVEEEIIQPKSSAKARAAVPSDGGDRDAQLNDNLSIEDAIIKPRAQRLQHAPPPSSSDADEARAEDVAMQEVDGTKRTREKYYVNITDGPDGEGGQIAVEYSELEQADLEKVCAALLEAKRLNKSSMNDTASYDRNVIRQLEKKLGRGWRSQTNPVLTCEEVEHAESCIAVLRDSNDARIMVWKQEGAAGCCFCC